jgi:hypothetical protein
VEALAYKTEQWLTLRKQLYYNKRSQFVSGNETEKVNVCIGQRVSNTHLQISARDLTYFS